MNRFIGFVLMQKGPFPSKSLVYNPLCFQSRNQGLQRLSFLPLSLSKILQKWPFRTALQAPYRHSRYHPKFSFFLPIHIPPCCLQSSFLIYFSCFLWISSFTLDALKKRKLKKIFSHYRRPENGKKWRWKWFFCFFLLIEAFQNKRSLGIFNIEFSSTTTSSLT